MELGICEGIDDSEDRAADVSQKKGQESGDFPIPALTDYHVEIAAELVTLL